MSYHSIPFRVRPSYAPTSVGIRGVASGYTEADRARDRDVERWKRAAKMLGHARSLDRPSLFHYGEALGVMLQDAAAVGRGLARRELTIAEWEAVYGP